MATEESSFAPPSKPAPGQARGRLAGVLASRKAKLRTALVVVGAVVIVFVIIPRIFHALHTVSTDDAYVNSYVTFVAPRVSGQVARVLVDDNNRVKKGDVLVELDPEPFRVQVASKEEFDQKREQLGVANAQVKQALENVYQARAALGLPAQPPEGANLADVPPNLDQTFSSVREALGNLMEAAAQLGVVSSSWDLTPKQVVEEFYRRDPGGDINKIYAEIIKTAPGLKQAEAKLMQAQRDLDQAELNLRYSTIVAEIDGVITRRNVNPGNNVQVGQSLMAIRSLRDIWVDANFQETQLHNLRIGQRVAVKADMYGSKHKFEGRISGFTFGTGSTLALLPPQNATGNFVKVVQRLPVRIDLVNYDPDKVPLFVGLSVTPSVDLWSKPTGPNAGKFLQELIPRSEPATPTPAK